MSNIEINELVINEKINSSERLDKMSLTYTEIEDNSDYHIIKEEIYDADIMDLILRDPQFSVNDKRHLGVYKKSRSHGARSTTIYDYGKECKDLKIGRLFAKDFSGLQLFSKDIRNPLLEKNYWDIDMENCHYWLMRNFCENAGLKNSAISQYCDNRDKELLKVSSNRELAKMSFLKTAYGGNVHLHDLSMSDNGEEPDGDISLINNIKLEITTAINYVKGMYPNITKIATDICKKKKIWLDKKGKKIFWSVDYTTLALVLQTEERKCLRIMDTTFKNNNRSMDIYLHDGGFVRKLENETSFPTELMRLAEKNVKELLGYTIRLVNKPIKHNFKIPEKKTDIIDDEYASRVFIKLMGSNIMRSENDVFFYNEDKGMWENGDTAFRFAVIRNKHNLIFIGENNTVHNYGGCEKNVMSMRKWITSCIPEITTFDDTKSKGCLLFTNGWYDIFNQMFNEGFNECRNKYFTKYINRDFNELRNSLIEAEVRKVLFENPFNSLEIGKFYLNVICRAIAGCIEDKMVPFIVGNTNSGKSATSSAISETFGGFVGTFNTNVFKLDHKDSTDEAKKLMWIVSLIGCRIALGNECRMGKKDGNLIKALGSGGDPIVLRANHQNPYTVKLLLTYISYMNDMGEISPCDQAVRDRMCSIPHTKSFVNKPQSECDEYEMESDLLLKDKIKSEEWKNAFFWIVMDSYNGGVRVPKPKEVIDEINELFITEDIQLKVLIEEKYEFVSSDDPDNCVPAREIISYLNQNGIRMSDTKIGRELKKIGLKTGIKKMGNKTTRVYFGLRSEFVIE